MGTLEQRAARACVLRILVQTQVPVQSCQPAVLRITVAPASRGTLEPLAPRFSGLSRLVSCQLSNPCDKNAQCNLTSNGTQFCTCNNGYVDQGSGLKGDCLSVCYVNDPCSFLANCALMPNGTVNCTCRNGFYGDGYDCEDRCNNATTCDANAVCSHTQSTGNINCTCKPGFTNAGTGLPGK
ncbi:unnamed protein product [Didymodactylos carnosus]|nr:unnamed protein product [Didymodactylos carnosus]CAF4217524.1 unnamed protein product [Didymodactylos carnosus]